MSLRVYCIGLTAYLKNACFDKLSMSGMFSLNSSLFPFVLSLSKDSSVCWIVNYSHYLCTAAAGTTYSGYFVAGAPCTIV